MAKKPITLRARVVEQILVSPRTDKAGALLTLYLSDRTDIDLAIAPAVARDLISRLQSILGEEDQKTLEPT